MPIVSAVGTIVGSTNPDNRDMAQFIEDAMVAETAQAQFEGVTDDAVILQRKLAARDRARQQWERAHA